MIESNILTDPSQRPGSLESIFTSTNIKLYQHLDRLQDAQKGKWKPISLQVAPTDRCDFECSFCSTGYRNYTEVTDIKEVSGKLKITGTPKKPDEIPFEDLKKTIEDLMYMGPLKTVEITGGGNPTLYPEINELIEFCSDEYGLEVGLITNNIEGRILQENLDKLKWLRISLAYLDKENFYRPIKFKAIDIPKIKGDIGFSYVWNRYSTVDKLDLIAEIAQKHDAKMVRIVPNCLNPQEQFNYRQNIEPLISNINNRLGKDVLFFQGKDYSVHEACYIGKLKPFLNADGYFYHCSAVPLYNRKFTEHWRMGHMSKVKQIWDNDKPFATDKCKEGMCFYKPQNVVLHSLKIEPPHKDFI